MNIVPPCDALHVMLFFSGRDPRDEEHADRRGVLQPLRCAEQDHRGAFAMQHVVLVWGQEVLWRELQPMPVSASEICGTDSLR